MDLTKAVQDAQEAARVANEAEAHESVNSPVDWRLFWEACRCWCVASGLTPDKAVAKDYADRAWLWAKKATAWR